MSEHWSRDVFNAWRTDDGDYALRLYSHDLGPEPLIVELGAYKGDATARMREHWPDAEIWSIEPVGQFFAELAARFLDDNKTHCFNCALGDSERIEYALVDGYGTNILSERGDVPIQVYPAVLFFYRSLQDRHVDLFEMNIEGAEYDLLDHMLDKDLMSRIGNLQVQFHDVLPDAYARMCSIRERLSETHEATYMYDFVFENWRLK